MIKHISSNTFQIHVLNHGAVQFIFNPAFFQGQGMTEQEAEEYIEDIFNTVIASNNADQVVFIHLKSIADVQYSILCAFDKNYVPPDNWWEGILG